MKNYLQPKNKYIVAFGKDSSTNYYAVCSLTGDFYAGIKIMDDIWHTCD